MSRAARTSSGPRTKTISPPGVNTVSMPSHTSERIGTPQAAASNRRMLGLNPTATMSARVMFRVNRLAL